MVKNSQKEPTRIFRKYWANRKLVLFLIMLSDIFWTRGSVSGFMQHSLLLKMFVMSHTRCPISNNYGHQDWIHFDSDSKRNLRLMINTGRCFCSRAQMMMHYLLHGQGQSWTIVWMGVCFSRVTKYSICIRRHLKFFYNSIISQTGCQIE